MNIWDYYKILGIRQGATEDEIRKAYRRKAMEYHPDRNHSPQAQELFVRATEAYEYLISHPYRRNISEEEYLKNYQAWIDYRQAQARKRAEEYSRTAYKVFIKSPIYKSTTVIDGSMVFMGLALAISVIIFALYGYFYRLARAQTPEDNPSLSLFLITLTIGTSYLIISVVYLCAWVEQRRKKKDGEKKENKESF